MSTPAPGQSPDPFAKPGQQTPAGGPAYPPAPGMSPGGTYQDPAQGYPGYPPGPGDPNAGYGTPPGGGYPPVDPNAGYGYPPGGGYPGDPNAAYGQPGYPPGPGYTPAPGDPGFGYPQPGYGQPGPWGPDPGAPYGRHPMTGEPLSDKDKLTAGLLEIFLGWCGAGRWYLGDYGIATAQLLTCGGLHIWSLIDGIMMLTGKVRDKQGRLLRD